MTMTLATFVAVLLFIPWIALVTGIIAVPEPKGDITFDWIKARYTYEDRNESEMEMERRLR